MAQPLALEPALRTHHVRHQIRLRMGVALAEFWSLTAPAFSKWVTSALARRLFQISIAASMSRPLPRGNAAQVVSWFDFGLREEDSMQRRRRWISRAGFLWSLALLGTTVG